MKLWVNNSKLWLTDHKFSCSSDETSFYSSRKLDYKEQTYADIGSILLIVWLHTGTVSDQALQPWSFLDIIQHRFKWECKYPASVDQTSHFDLLTSKCKFHVMLDCVDVQIALGTMCKWEPCEQLPVRLTKAFPTEAFPVARLRLKWTVSWVHMHSWKSGNPSATLLT